MHVQSQKLLNELIIRIYRPHTKFIFLSILSILLTRKIDLVWSRLICIISSLPRLNTINMSLKEKNVRTIFIDFVLVSLLLTFNHDLLAGRPQ